MYIYTIETNKQQNYQVMKTVTVPTQLLEAMKQGIGARFYNNQLDQTMSNVHFKMQVERLITRGLEFTNYTDGENQLIVVGSGANQKHFSGTSMLSA